MLNLVNVDKLGLIKSRKVLLWTKKKQGNRWIRIPHNVFKFVLLSVKMCQLFSNLATMLILFLPLVKWNPAPTLNLFFILLKWNPVSTLNLFYPHFSVRIPFQQKDTKATSFYSPFSSNKISQEMYCIIKSF